MDGALRIQLLHGHLRKYCAGSEVSHDLTTGRTMDDLIVTGSHLLSLELAIVPKRQKVYN